MAAWPSSMLRAAMVSMVASFNFVKLFLGQYVDCLNVGGEVEDSSRCTGNIDLV